MAPTFSCYSRVGGWQAGCLSSRLQRELQLDFRTAQELARQDPEAVADLLLMLDYGRTVDAFLNGSGQVVKVTPLDPSMIRELERIRRGRALTRYIRWGLSIGGSGAEVMTLKAFLNAADRFEQLRGIELTVRSLGSSREAYVLLDMYFRKRYRSEEKVGCGQEEQSAEEAWESLRWDEDLVYRTVSGPLMAARRGWEREGSSGEEDLQAWAEFSLQAYRMTACPESWQIREELGRELWAGLSRRRR